jgi:hypothetical protein
MHKFATVSSATARFKRCFSASSSFNHCLPVDLQSAIELLPEKIGLIGHLAPASKDCVVSRHRLLDSQQLPEYGGNSGFLLREGEMKKIIKRTRRFAFALVTSVPLASAASTVTQCGPDVCFQYDDAQSGVAVFGLPTLLLNSVRFDPGFRVESNNTTGISATSTGSAEFVFDRVYAIDQVIEIGEVLVVDTGRYSISGDSLGALDYVSDQLSTTVANNASDELLSDSTQFAASGNSGGVRTWTLGSSGLLPELSFAANARDLKVTVRNTLTAVTDEAGGDAWIEKGFFLYASPTPPIPIPGASWLFASALGALFARRMQS